MSYGREPPQCRPQMICKYNTICAIGKAKTPFFELRPTARATTAGPVGRRRTQVSRGAACPSARTLLPHHVTHCATMRCKTAHFTLRKGPFRNAIRAVSQGEMGRFANRYGHGCGRGRHFYRTDIWRYRRTWLPLPTIGTCRRESAWIVVPRKQYQWQVSYLANGADCSSAQNCQTLRSPYKQGRNADYGSMLVGAYHVLMSRRT